MPLSVPGMAAEVTAMLGLCVLSLMAIVVILIKRWLRTDQGKRFMASKWWWLVAAIEFGFAAGLALRLTVPK